MAAYAALPTKELRLDPAFHEAIKELAPKKRRSRSLYVLGIALLVLGLVFAASPLRALVAGLVPTTAPSASGVPASTDPGVASAPVSSAASSVSAPAGSDPSIGGAAAPIVRRPSVSTPDRPKHRHATQ